MDLEREFKWDYQTDQIEIGEVDERVSWMGWRGENDTKAKVNG